MPYIVCEGKTNVPEESAAIFGGRTEIPFVRIGGCGDFSVEKTFDCGQAFRFDPVSLSFSLSESCRTVFAGIAFDLPVAFGDLGGGEIIVFNSTSAEFEEIWLHYLALDEDYDAINRFIINAMPCEADRAVMAAAVESGRGIRILRQAPFECLISFIISQNNNIPRIKKLISALCEKYGENGRFPTAEALVGAGVDGLSALKTGFRAGYIYDAACKISSGEISLAEILACEDYDKCAAELTGIRGVGPKVSACALLFGFNKTEAFPVDVWIKKSLSRHFPNGFDPKSLGKYAGIAQQYLFYYERYLGGEG